jgi:hypothetical protein
MDYQKRNSTGSKSRIAIQQLTSTLHKLSEASGGARIMRVVAGLGLAALLLALEVPGTRAPQLTALWRQRQSAPTPTTTALLRGSPAPQYSTPSIRRRRATPSEWPRVPMGKRRGH